MLFVWIWILIDRSVNVFMNESSLDRRLLSELFHDVLSASPSILNNKLEANRCRECMTHDAHVGWVDSSIWIRISLPWPIDREYEPMPRERFGYLSRMGVLFLVYFCLRICPMLFFFFPIRTLWTGHCIIHFNVVRCWIGCFVSLEISDIATFFGVLSPIVYHQMQLV